MNQHITLAGKLIVLVGLLGFPLYGTEFYTELVAKIMILAIFAMSLSLLVGFTGLVSFGHAAYFGIAAYAVALLSSTVGPSNLWLMMILAVLVTGIAACVIGLFVLRTRGIYFIMVTLAFAQMTYYIFHDTPLGGGSDGLYLDHRPDASLFGFGLFNLSEITHLYYFITAMLLGSYVLLRQILRSPFGRILVGIRSNEHRMQSLGYITFRYKLAAFTLAGALAGLAGFLHTVLFGFVTPESLSWHKSGDVLLMVILGGTGSLAGAIAGAFTLVGLQELFSDWTQHWQLLMGSMIILAVLFLPGGLAALPGRITRTFSGVRNHD